MQLTTQGGASRGNNTVYCVTLRWPSPGCARTWRAGRRTCFAASPPHAPGHRRPPPAGWSWRCRPASPAAVVRVVQEGEIDNWAAQAGLVWVAAQRVLQSLAGWHRQGVYQRAGGNATKTASHCATKRKLGAYNRTAKQHGRPTNPHLQQARELGVAEGHVRGVGVGSRIDAHALQ